MSLYGKQPLSFEDQADRLIQRGLLADREELIARLRVTSYYRLSGYLYAFREPDETYRTGTTLDLVWRLYTFDHRLRLLMLDAIESIEVQARTQLAYHFAHCYDPFGYLNTANLPNFDPARGDFKRWETRLREQMRRSSDPKGQEDFVIHFYRKYGDAHDTLPIWMLIELMDFGSTLSFFRGADGAIRKTVAATMGQPQEVMLSWLLALNAIRNRCAHHARLWNWKVGYPVLIPNERKFPEWHRPRMENNKMGIMLTICRYWLKQINPGSQWSHRVQSLFDEFPEIPVASMGLPPDWRNHPLWKA